MRSKLSYILIAILVVLGVTGLVVSLAVNDTYNVFEFEHADTGELGSISFDKAGYSCTYDDDVIYIKKHGDVVFKCSPDTEDGFNYWKSYDSLSTELISSQVENIGYHRIHYVVTEETLKEYKDAVTSFRNGYTDEQLEEMGIVIKDSELDIEAIGGTCDIYLYYIELLNSDSKTYFYLETVDSDPHTEDFLNINFSIK